MSDTGPTSRPRPSLDALAEKHVDKMHDDFYEQVARAVAMVKGILPEGKTPEREHVEKMTRVADAIEAALNPPRTRGVTGNQGENRGGRGNQGPGNDNPNPGTRAPAAVTPTQVITPTTPATPAPAAPAAEPKKGRLKKIMDGITK